MNKEEIRRKYDALASWYDLLVSVPENMAGAGRLRRKLAARARGDVLEIAAGTGRSLSGFPPGCRLTAVDLSPKMLAVARRRAGRLGLEVRFREMDAEALDFPDASFDTVVSCLGLCTYLDPLAALRQMARVCRPTGRLLLLEHGVSDRPWLGRLQNQWADRHAKALGCRWNREPLDLFKRAGLRLLAAERSFLGVFYLIEAAPVPSEELRGP
ncbi:MAG: methyltransferase domain-containing protein [Elusimicrobia bacterium]|nr:methyltransferase domain-containing protein [Elusimicrobiota bacterium]